MTPFYKNLSKCRFKKGFDWLFAFIFALFAHLLILGGISQLKAQKKPALPALVKVSLAPKTTAANSHQTKALKDEVPVQKQVVQTAPPSQEKRPDKADYLSEFNQSAKEETRSRKTGLAPLVTDGSLSKKTSALPHPFSSRPLPSSHINDRNEDEAAPSLPFGEKGIAQKAKSVAEQKSGSPSFKQQKRPSLNPSWQELEQLEGSAFPDHLPNVGQDNKTQLNTYSWQHALFFNRVKRSIVQYWSPLQQIQKYDATGSLLGRQTRLTTVLITIDRQGNLLDAALELSSGLHFLDEEALRAVRAASPFPHPPAALFMNKTSFSFPFSFSVGYEKGFHLDFNWQPNG